MNILVWKMHGEIEVYSAETVSDLYGIICAVIETLKYWPTDDALHLRELTEKVKKHSIENKESETNLVRRLRYNLFRFLENRGLTNAHDVDEFEYFHFQEVRKID